MRKIFIGVTIAVLCMGMVSNAQQLAAFLNGEFQDPNEKTVSGLSTANVPPVVEILPDVSRGKAPLVVHFDGDIYDEDGEVLSLEWDFEGDGVFEFSKNVKNLERPQRLQALKLGLQREHIYSNPGIYHAVARVTDDKGESTVSSVTIQVHSDRPYLDITPCDTGFDYMAQAGYEAFFKSGITDSESIWVEKCMGGECWEETITHTEYWIKQSVSFDQHHWSTPENVVQVKSTTGNPVVIEKQNGTFIMCYKDKYVWTEENCELVGPPWDPEWVCETITHTEYYIYRRTSTDGITWGSPVKIQQTATGIRNVAAIQKQDSTFLMCYTDKVGSSYYIRQKTSTDGITWSSASTIVQVNSGTENPALLQADNGTIYLAYKKGDNYIYVQSNSGSGWSSPVQTTGIAGGDPALLESESEIVIIYKGTDDYCYRISSSDGITWSTPSQIAPNKALTDPATVDRKDVIYRVTSQQISVSALDKVKMTEFSYGGDDYLARSTDVLISDAQTVKSSMHFGYDSKGRVVERIARDENGTQTEKIIYTYNNKNKVIRQDVYAGTSSEISYSVIAAYDDNGNVIYTRNPEGAEHYYSYANTDCENQFTDSKGLQVNLFSNAFYTNSVPSECHNLIVGEAYINNGKATETYYQYDTSGNLTEAKTLFPTRDYVVFSGTFDENGQTTFDFDLTKLTVTNGILVISSIAVPTQETLHETHSEIGNGWLNSGNWDEENFMADY
ncbi:MAG: exo-alpha-sialidase, partial [Theionarchaea archaeon]|nr:exo-alpha-sialidase [Theionarchaea archaeon]